MKQAGFFEGVWVALLISVLGSALFAVLTTFFSKFGVFQLVVTAISFCYITYLLLRSREVTGRMVIFTVWFSAAMLCLFFVNSILTFIMIHIIMIWLVRSLYYYTSIISAAIDLFLNVTSFVIATWTLGHTDSLFLALWCFFLIQALFVSIPVSFQKVRQSNHRHVKSDDRFERAYRIAEVAIRKLSTT